MLEDFPWWVAEKSRLNGVCLSVCLCVRSNILAPGALTARPIGTGESSFVAPERAERRWCQSRSDRCFVARATCQRANPCKKSVDKAAGLTNGQIGLKFCETMATIEGQNPGG